MSKEKIDDLKLMTVDRVMGVRVLVVIWLIVGLFAVLAWGFRAVSDWSAVNKVVLKSPIEIGFQAPVTVEKRKPLEVLSPLAAEVVQPVPSDLTPTEKKILAAFGERNFQVARAVAKCESGLAPLKTNWTTHDIGLFQINVGIWEKPVLEKFGYTYDQWYDVDKNIEIAKWIWDRNADGKGSWDPWVATRTDCFSGELK